MIFPRLFFQDVAVFLQEFKAPDILLGVIAKSRNPRLTVSGFTALTVYLLLVG